MLDHPVIDATESLAKICKRILAVALRSFLSGAKILYCFKESEIESAKRGHI